MGEISSTGRPTRRECWVGGSDDSRSPPVPVATRKTGKVSRYKDQAPHTMWRGQKSFRTKGSLGSRRRKEGRRDIHRKILNRAGVHAFREGGHQTRDDGEGSTNPF